MFCCIGELVVVFLSVRGKKGDRVLWCIFPIALFCFWCLWVDSASVVLCYMLCAFLWGCLRGFCGEGGGCSWGVRGRVSVCYAVHEASVSLRSL